MLLLFDIDGTLIRCGGAGRRALDRAFLARHGVTGALDGVRLGGSTDPRIVADAFERALGRAEPEPPEYEALIETYLSLLAEELTASGGDYLIMEGVRPLIERARESERFVIGLATGNVERGARIKLEPGGLNGYFSFGGYGSDAREREKLVAIAIERGQRVAERSHGRRFAPDEIFVFGDTESDVFAARAAGAVAVGVLCGSFAREELIASGPDLLVDSFGDPRLWSRLGLERDR